MKEVLFLKLGGSLITDKVGVEAVRDKVLNRLAQEIKTAKDNHPQLKLLIGHGSGSFGHVAGAKYGTRQGVSSSEQWFGFSEVSDAALRLNNLVMTALLAVGLPVLRLPPSASVICEDGEIQSMAVQPVVMALEAGLIPVIFGDVAFDQVRGGTIISTEEVMIHLAAHLQPTWLLLAGETTGVLDSSDQLITTITDQNLHQIGMAIGASRGTDVTGGMMGKVRLMLDLVALYPQMKVRIFSGLDIGNVEKIIRKPVMEIGTVIQSA